MALSDDTKHEILVKVGAAADVITRNILQKDLTCAGNYLFTRKTEKLRFSIFIDAFRSIAKMNREYQLQQKFLIKILKIFLTKKSLFQKGTPAKIQSMSLENIVILSSIFNDTEENMNNYFFLAAKSSGISLYQIFK